MRVPSDFTRPSGNLRHAACTISIVNGTMTVYDGDRDDAGGW